MPKRCQLCVATKAKTALVRCTLCLEFKCEHLIFARHKEDRSTGVCSKCRRNG